MQCRLRAGHWKPEALSTSRSARQGDLDFGSSSGEVRVTLDRCRERLRKQGKADPQGASAWKLWAASGLPTLPALCSPTDGE